jgi:adhesin transport system outer membrane protein
VARNKCEFHRLTVATAVAVCLPFSSLAEINTPVSTDAGAEALQHITEQDIASLPPMITQQQYGSQHAVEAPSVLQSIAAMDNIGEPAVVEHHAEVAPVPQAQSAPLIAPHSEEAKVANAAGTQVFAKSLENPVTIKTTEARIVTTHMATPATNNNTEAPVLAKSGQTWQPAQSHSEPVLVDRKRLAATLNRADTALPTGRSSEAGKGSNPAALKNNPDFFPPVQKYYQPDPAYNNVRWNGEIDGESGQRTPVNATPASFKSQRNSASRAFLRQMVSLALTHSPEIRSSEADVLAAGYQVDQTKGQRWPQVQLGIATPLSNQGSSNTTRNNTKISDTSGSISVTTPIYDWGKISNQIDSAEEGVNAAVSSQNYTKEQLAYSTISELMNLSRYQENRAVALAYVGRMKQLADMLEQITAADKGRASEFTQAKAKLLSARASLDDIEHQVSSSRIKLVRLLGIEPNIPANISWQDSVMPSSMALAALNKNPNLLKLQAQVKAAEYDAESIQAANLPQLNWVVSKNTAKDINGDETGWYTGLNVQWNAFSGGSQKAAQMAARAKANGAQQQYEVAYRDLEYQINSMIQTRDSSFMRADDFDRLSVETDRVRKMFYDQWYNLGKRTLLDVLTAENDHFNNQLSAINNRYDGYISNINVIASAAMLLSWVGK